MANTKLLRTFGTPTSTKTGTFSFWMKLSSSSNNGIINNYGDNNNRAILYMASEQLYFYDAAAGDNPYSSRKLRDLNCWYHIILRIDTTQGAAADRCRIYINGEQETLTNTAYNPNENSYMFNANTPFGIGKDDSGSDYFNGSISHFHYCDGQSYAPTVFGETDATTGEWKIKTSPSITMGNQGFTILKDGNTITDQSTNSNDFSLSSGTLTKTEDSPSNVFPTWNRLDYITNTYSSSITNGNTTILSTTNDYPSLIANMGAKKGKFYWEVKVSASSGGANAEAEVGIASTQTTTSTQELGEHPNDWGYYSYDGKYRNNNTSTSYGSTFTVGDIISVAMDLDNNKLYFRKNNDAWNNSGDPTSGSTGTGAISITDPDSTPLGFYFPAVCVWSSGINTTFQANFGNGYFGTTAVSSAGTNASGNGIFEYDVPSGYTALSTKGLNL